MAFRVHRLARQGRGMLRPQSVRLLPARDRLRFTRRIQGLRRVVVVAVVRHRQRTVICESTRVTPSWRCARLVAICTWSCDFTVPPSVTTPPSLFTLMSASLSPGSDENAAMILPLVTVSETTFVPPAFALEVEAEVAAVFPDALSLVVGVLLVVVVFVLVSVGA